jgi:hypothetical protein
MPILCNFEPSELLDLAGLYGDVRDVQAQNLFQLKIDQLRGIESPRNSIQGTGQGPPGRIFRIEPEAFSAAWPVHPLKVPALLSNHGVQNRRCDLCDESPAIADRLAQEIHAVGQDAILAQENRVRLQTCALFDTLGTSGWKEPGK